MSSAGERTIIKLDSLPSRVMNNKVLLQVNDNLDDGNEYETKSGLKIILAGGEDWQESTRVVRFGKVVRVPNRLVLRSKSAPKGLEWETDMELEVGDTVYMTIMCSANAELIEVGDNKYFLVDYSELIMRVRDGVTTPLNGYCIVQKVVENKIKIDGLILEFQEEVHDKKRGVVKYVGSRNKKYMIGSNVDADVKVGDDIIFSIEAWTALEDELFAELDSDLGYIQRSWVSCKI